ncbi:MAG: hypothetical protein M3O31_02760 [Acidobacteriota bacterium]|nr:hypothetical protein [Acidobacteriota bacterium]
MLTTQCESDVLMILSAQEFVELRTSERQEDYLRAATDTAPLEVWVDVIHGFPEMKVWVAHNKTVSLEVLKLLASDSDPRVRLAVAMKNKLPHDLMVQLGRDTEASVRQRVAHNKNASIEILEEVAQDESELVSATARARLYPS